MDFYLDQDSFPLEVKLDSENGIESPPELTVTWFFTLAWGFDGDQGFFLYTFPDETQEFRVDALLSVLDLSTTGYIHYLRANIKDLNINVAASVSIDMDKARALRSDQEESNIAPQFGRLTRSNIKHEMTALSDMFEIGAAAATTIDSYVHYEVYDPDDGASRSMIPSLYANTTAHARTTAGNLNETALEESTRRLWMDTNGRRSLQAKAFSSHPARSLFQFITASDLLEEDFAFNACPLSTEGPGYCARLIDVQVNLGELRKILSDILSPFISATGDGLLDYVFDPTVRHLSTCPGFSPLSLPSFIHSFQSFSCSISRFQGSLL